MKMRLTVSHFYMDLIFYTLFTLFFIYPVAFFKYSEVKNWDWVYYSYIVFTIIFFVFRRRCVNSIGFYLVLYPFIVNFCCRFLFNIYYAFYFVNKFDVIDIFYVSILSYVIMHLYVLNLLLFISYKLTKYINNKYA